MAKDLIRFYFPISTESQLEDVLWMCTAFPCVNIRDLHTQIYRAARRSNFDPIRACQQADRDISQIMAKYRKRNRRCFI